MSAQMLSIAQAAAYLGVSKDTLRRWEKQGKVTAERTSGGIRLFHKADLAAIRFPSVLSVSAAAEYLQVSSSTVRRLADSGILPFTKDAKGRRTFLRDTIALYIRSKSYSSITPNHLIANKSPVKHWLNSKYIITGLFSFVLFTTLLLLFVPFQTDKVTEVVNPEITGRQQAAVLGDHDIRQSLIEKIIFSIQRLLQSSNTLLTSTTQQHINTTQNPHPTYIPGATGATGATGSRGLAGATGASGTAGKDGTDGEKGDRGETGSGGQGATGATGIVGATGAGGTSGDSLFSTNQNLLFPAISSDRSLALGNISNDPSTTSTSSARIFLDGSTGYASISGALTVGNGQAIRSAFGPVQLQYKSGPNAWTTGFYMQDSTGNIGIGTTNPAGNLHIYGESTQPLTFFELSHNGQGAAGILFRRSRQNATPLTSNDHLGSIYYQMLNSNSEYVNSIQFTAYAEDTTDGTEDAGLFLRTIDNGSYTEKLRINSLGLIGVGTTSPASRLDIQGGFAGNAAVTVNQTNAGDIFTASSSGTPRFTITNAGNVGIGTTTPTRNLFIQAPSNAAIAVGSSSTNYGYLAWTNGSAVRLETPGYFFPVEMSGNIFSVLTAGTERFRITNTGATGIGTTSPASRLDIQGGFEGNAAVTVNQTNAGDIFTASSSGTPRFTITNAGDVGIGTITPAQRLQVAGDVRVGTGTDGCVEDADGTLIAGACSSDIQLKENIVALPAMLNKLTSLTAVTYTWKSGYNKGSQAEIGIIAQDVERVLPQLVTVGADGYKRVRFQYIPIVLLQGVKELAAKVDALETSPLQLQQQLAQQSTQLSQLAQQLERVEQKTLPENNATVSAVLSETTQRLTALEEEVGKLANKTVSNTSSFSLSSTESAVLKLVSTGDEPMATTSGLWIDHQLTVLGSTSLADAIIAGNVLIAGTIRITPSGLVDINGELTLQGTVTIDDSGKLTAPRVTTQELRTRSFVTVNGHTAGKAVVAATQSAQTIETAAVTPESLIFINSRNTSENLLRITEQKQGSFTVERTGPQTESIPFDWFVIQIEHDIKEEEQP